MNSENIIFRASGVQTFIKKGEHTEDSYELAEQERSDTFFSRRLVKNIKSL